MGSPPIVRGQQVVVQLAGRSFGFDQHHVVESFNSIVPGREHVNLRRDFYESRRLGPSQVNLNVRREHERRLLAGVLDDRQVIHFNPYLSTRTPLKCHRPGAQSGP